jgi:hypothetical protein
VFIARSSGRSTLIVSAAEAFAASDKVRQAVAVQRVVSRELIINFSWLFLKPHHRDYIGIRVPQ